MCFFASTERIFLCLNQFDVDHQVPEVLLEKIKDAILQHVVDSMRQEGTAYVGK